MRLTIQRFRRILTAILILTLLVPWASQADEAIRVPGGEHLEGFLQKADELLQESAGQDTLGAALVVFSDAGVLESRGFGNSDVAGEEAVSPDQTLFEYGSVTKVFVWLSAMQLCQDGKLDLDRSISAYLPEEDARRLVPSHPVTMLDLMNHRAGFEENPLDMMLKEGETKPSLRDALLSAVPQQRYQPGTVSSYSNYGCALAAYVIECLSGQPFEAYVQQHILTPLEMVSCTFDEGTPGCAEGSALTEEGQMAPVAPSRVRLYPSGGLSGTAQDLARVGVAMLSRDERLFSKSNTFDQLFSDSYAPAPGLDGMAHGLFTMNARAGKGYQHAGNTNGFTAQFVIVPEYRLGYVLLCNTAYVNHLGHALSRLFVGEADKLQDLPGSAPPEASAYFVSGRSAFRMPFYSLLSYVNAYHLALDGEEARLTSALLRVLSLFGADDMQLVAKRVSGPLYQVLNRPEMVETLYVEHDNAEVTSLWSDGNQLIPIAMTPHRSYPLILGSAILMILLMTGFLISLPVQVIRRLYRGIRGRKQAALPPLLMGIAGAGMSLSYLLGVFYVASCETPFSTQVNGYTAGIWTFSVAAAGILLYHTLRGNFRAWGKPARRAFVVRTVQAAVLAVLFLLWNQYCFV